MLFTSEEDLPIKDNTKQYIFLEGSMEVNSSNNWRKQVITKLNNKYFIFDPTNNNHDNLNQKDMKSHIKWELGALNLADKIILNFLPDALSPISLVELGLYVSTTKLVVVCPKKFYKSRYVYTLCKTYNTPVFKEIDRALHLLS